LVKQRYFNAEEKPHLHGGTVEVNLAEFEHQDVVTIFADWDVITETGVMISLCLVQNGIWLRHPADIQILSPII